MSRALFVLFILTGTTWAGDDQALAKRLAAEVTIHRDGFGVAHAFGKTDEAALFGFVYARAEDEFRRVEERITRMLGRYSEVRGEAGVAWDRVIRAAEWPKLARAEYARAPKPIQRLYAAAAAALNHYLRKHPRVKPRAITRYEPWHITASERGFQVHFLMQAAASLNRRPTGGRDERDGSNVWAIGPARCAKAPGESSRPRSMLFINPHIRLHEVWEGHLRSDTGLNVYGGSAYGSVLPLIGFNPHLGWSLTVNYPDVVDIYLETFETPGAPLAYRYGKETRTATQWKETLKVKTAAGLVKRTITLTKTHHGPLLGRVGKRMAAVKVPRMVEGGMFEQVIAMCRARDLTGFKAAVARRAMIFHNLLYADKTGAIHYVYNGAIPKRSPAFDWSKPVDGSDPRTEWQGLHPIGDLPQVTNPKSGYLQNCNSTPRTTTTGLTPRRYPGYLVGPEPDNLRAINSRRILGGPKTFTFEQWTRASLDLYVPARVTWIPFLRTAWDAWSASDPKRAATYRAPLELIEAWDGYARADAPGATLFLLWYEWAYPTLLREKTLTHAAALRAFVRVVDQVTRQHKTWRVPWGRVNRLQRPVAGGFSDARPSLPAVGAHGGTGIIFNFISSRPRGSAKRYGVHGNSFVCVVAFGPDGPRARSIVPFGVQREPGRPHAFDQARLYAAGRMKEVRFTVADVKRHAKASYQP